jgi:hypothetical protein
MACGRVLLERVEKLHQMRLEDLLARAAFEVVQQGAASRDSPKVDEGRRRPDVIAREAEGLFDAPNCMPDVDSEIPQRVEQSFGQRTDERVVRVVAQENDVDVAV